jgi:hypothetical protein
VQAPFRLPTYLPIVRHRVSDHAGARYSKEPTIDAFLQHVPCLIDLLRAMHEIITLQLGQRSNYLATHFWNTQVRKESSRKIREPQLNPNQGVLFHLLP